MEQLPTPFTAEQIRDASRDRRLRLVTEAPDAEPVHSVTEFVGWSDAGVTMRATTVDADGVPVEPPIEHWATWDDLRRHALFPAADTTLTDERITTPLGALDTLRYSRDVGDRQLVFWFAVGFPGMPVRYETRVGGVVVSSTTVVESGVEPGAG